MNLFSEAHIRKLYAQGVGPVVRLVHRLADRVEELETQPVRNPQPVIASLSKELARAKSTLAHQSQELLRQQQLNHQLLRRIRELEREVERDSTVERDSHDSVRRKRPPLSPSRRLVNRLLRRREEVLRFLSDLSVPFTNNGAERDLRMIKVQQKIGGCFRSEDGARAFCRVRSYLSTARKQGYPLLSALERVLNGKPLAFSPAAGAG